MPFNVFTKFDISKWGVDTFSTVVQREKKQKQQQQQTNKQNNFNFALSRGRGMPSQPAILGIPRVSLPPGTHNTFSLVI